MKLQIERQIRQQYEDKGLSEPQHSPSSFFKVKQNQKIEKLLEKQFEIYMENNKETEFAEFKDKIGFRDEIVSQPVYMSVTSVHKY